MKNQFFDPLKVRRFAKYSDLISQYVQNLYLKKAGFYSDLAPESSGLVGWDPLSELPEGHHGWESLNGKNMEHHPKIFHCHM